MGTRTASTMHRHTNRHRNVSSSASPSLERLDHAQAGERMVCLEALSKLEPRELAEVAPSIARMMLDDDDWGVRCTACSALGGLDVEDLDAFVDDLNSNCRPGHWREMASAKGRCEA